MKTKIKAAYFIFALWLTIPLFPLLMVYAYLIDLITVMPRESLKGYIKIVWVAYSSLNKEYLAKITNSKSKPEQETA
jgi:hypothetical protein